MRMLTSAELEWVNGGVWAQSFTQGGGGMNCANTWLGCQDDQLGDDWGLLEDFGDFLHRLGDAIIDLIGTSDDKAHEMEMMNACLASGGDFRGSDFSATLTGNGNANGGGATVTVQGGLGYHAPTCTHH